MTIIIGLIVGGIASLLVRGRTPGGIFGVLLVGILGALVGDYFFNNFLLVFITAVIAAAIVIVIINSVLSRR